MPAVIDSGQTLSNRMTLTRDEALVIANELNLLRQRLIDQLLVVNSAGSPLTLTIQRDGTHNVERSHSYTIADTALAESFTIHLAGHNLIRFMHALQNWHQNDVWEYILETTNKDHPTLHIIAA